MVVVYGEVAIDSAVRARFLDSARASVPVARAEVGNLAYVIAADALDPNALHLIEIWDSQAALERHRTEPAHIKRLAELREMGVDWGNVRVFDADARP